MRSILSVLMLVALFSYPILSCNKKTVTTKTTEQTDTTKVVIDTTYKVVEHEVTIPADSTSVQIDTGDLKAFINELAIANEQGDSEKLEQLEEQIQQLNQKSERSSLRFGLNNGKVTVDSKCEEWREIVEYNQEQINTLVELTTTILKEKTIVKEKTRFAKILDALSTWGGLVIGLVILILLKR